MSATRCPLVLSMLLIIGLGGNPSGRADESSKAAPESETRSTAVVRLSEIDSHRFGWTAWTGSLPLPQIDLPRSHRSSVSRQPLRQVTLWGGDRFFGECLNWSGSASEWRLLNGQKIQVPPSAIVQVASPPGEFDLLDESFETGSIVESEPQQKPKLDDTQAVDGNRSLRIDSTPYTHSLSLPLPAARVQFWFRTDMATEPDDVASTGGGWTLIFRDAESRDRPILIDIRANRTAAIQGLPAGPDKFSQSLRLSDDWHSFVAIISPERTRMIIDGASLASFPTAGTLGEVQFHSTPSMGTNHLWIDEFQIQKRQDVDNRDHLRQNLIDRDLIWTSSGDELFGQLNGINRTDITGELFGEQQSFPWRRLGGVVWRRPTNPIAQANLPRTGVMARVELQPFADRPECLPDSWDVTIISVDAKQLVALHPLVGELTFAWSEIRRITPQFYGRTLLVDARQFHLGNSIRSDLVRHLPDGTEWEGEFKLAEIPNGLPFVSLDVAEIEAASPDAPVASPFLTDLRAGKLVTDVFINEERIGDLNSLIRFKAASRQPDRLRLRFSRDILRTGQNSIRLRQQPANDREYDDGEVGSIRVDFELQANH